jgi:short-subunit dehydrogenase
MSKPTATASQGIGQATEVRLSRDFSALALVARMRANLEQMTLCMDGGEVKSSWFQARADGTNPPSKQMRSSA